MKRISILLIAIATLVSCGNNAEKEASKKLQLAEEAFRQDNFSEAKTLIDSIKTVYPKAIKARREGIKLMQQVERKEAQLNLVRLDSMLTEKQAAFEEIKGKYILEKDTAYQDIGNYFWPTQTVEKNLHRSFLRFQVDETGRMTMTSVYCGKSNINHIAVKVTAPDGTFAETPASVDSYHTTDLGEKIEKADFRLGQDGDVINFLYLNHDKNIRVEYSGDRKYATTMSADDRKAAAGVFELARILSSIETIKTEISEANRQIEFVDRNIQNREEKKEN